jgi:hypothetical protein
MYTEAFPISSSDVRSDPVPLESTVKDTVCDPVPLAGLMLWTQLSGALAVQVLQPISPTGGVYAEEYEPPELGGSTSLGTNVPASHTKADVVPAVVLVVTVKLARSLALLPLTTNVNVEG